MNPVISNVCSKYLMNNNRQPSFGTADAKDNPYVATVQAIKDNKKAIAALTATATAGIVAHQNRRGIETQIGKLVNKYSSVDFMERRLVYGPIKTPKIFKTEKALKGKTESKFFESFDGTKLNYWHVKGEPGKPTVFFVHGSRGNLTWHQHKMAEYAKRGYQIFSMDYRGFGKSKGKPNDEDIKKDLQMFFQLVKHESRLKTSDIFVDAHSLGGTFAVPLVLYLESKGEKPAGLILEGTPTSVADMREQMLEELKGDKSKVQLFKEVLEKNPATQNLSTIEGFDQIKTQTLIVHSKEDAVVPVEHARELKETNPDAELVILPKGNHSKADWQEPTKLKFIENIHYGSLNN